MALLEPAAGVAKGTSSGLRPMLRTTPDGWVPRAPLVAGSTESGRIRVAFLSYVDRPGRRDRRQALFVHAHPVDRDGELASEEILPGSAHCGALGDLQAVDGDRFALLAICSGTGGRPVDAKHLWIGFTDGPDFVEVEPSLNHVDEAWLGVVEGGFWVFWRRDSAAGRIWARRLDSRLQPVSDPSLVLDLGGGSVALARSHIVPMEGGQVALAWKGNRESEESSLWVSTLAGDGRVSAAEMVFEDGLDARSTSFSLSKWRGNLLVAWIVESPDRSTLHLKELTVGLEPVASEAVLSRSIDRGYLHSVRLSPFGTPGILAFLEPSFSGGYDLRVLAVPDDLSQGLGAGCRIAEGLPTLEHWLLSGLGGALSVALTEPSAGSGGWLGYRAQIEDLLASDCDAMRAP